MIDAAPGWIDDVLAFWFDELSPRDWFRGGDAVDARIRDRFAALHETLARTRPDESLASPRAALATILVLDQFSRNLYRDDARAFASDAVALQLARDAVARGFDTQLPKLQRSFLYLPFMHAEDLGAQDEGVALYTDAGIADQLDYARHHRDVIARFGRFPHRNRVLGRTSSADELAWLEHPDPKAGAAAG